MAGSWAVGRIRRCPGGFGWAKRPGREEGRREGPAGGLGPKGRRPEGRVWAAAKLFLYQKKNRDRERRKREKRRERKEGNILPNNL